MNRSFLVREWGAVSFVLTVLVGMVAVPLALYFGHAGSAAGVSGPVPAATASATPSASASPSPSPTR